MSTCVQHILQNSLLHDLLPACNIHLHWRCLCAFLPIGDRLFWLKCHLAEELGVAGAAWHTVRCGLRAVCWKAGDYFWKPLFFFFLQLYNSTFLSVLARSWVCPASSDSCLQGKVASLAAKGCLGVDIWIPGEESWDLGLLCSMPVSWQQEPELFIAKSIAKIKSPICGHAFRPWFRKVAWKAIMSLGVRRSHVWFTKHSVKSRQYRLLFFFFPLLGT